MLVLTVCVAKRREENMIRSIRFALGLSAGLVILVAVVTWLALRRTGATPGSEIVSAIHQEGGYVEFDGKRSPEEQNDESVKFVSFWEDHASDALLAALARLPKLKELGLFRPKGSDLVYVGQLSDLERFGCMHGELHGDELVPLTQLKNLSALSFAATRIDDDGMAQIAKITSLRELFLCGTDLTDDGLMALQNLTNLEKLTISSQHVTDDGLQYLRPLKRLTVLNLGGKNLTEVKVRQLKESLGIGQEDN
jgi:hypothetical protein